LDRRVERPVELVERFSSRKLSRLHAPVDLSLLAHQQFVLEDQFQELGVAELVAGGFLQANVEGLARPDSRSWRSVDCRRSFIGCSWSNEEGGTTVESSGETEPGSAEEQPGEGYPDPGGSKSAGFLRRGLVATAPGSGALACFCPAMPFKTFAHGGAIRLAMDRPRDELA
jgi:hypothetical protein